MKVIFAFLFMSLFSAVLCGQPVDGNSDAERIGFEIEHWQEDGTFIHHYKNLRWIQGGRSDFTKLGLAFQGPMFSRVTIGGSTGIIRTFKKSEETYELSGYDYDGDGIYWKVYVWYNFRSE